MKAAKHKPANLPDLIDHLIFAAPDLESGMRHIEDVLGTRPAIGGRHPAFGTHNALVSLGSKIYLEIIAPDPDAPAPARGRLLGVSDRQVPRLVTWVMRSQSILETVAYAQAAGVKLGNVESGSRQVPDGTLLTWKLSDPYALPFAGAIPFLIDWGDTPHPAESAPRAGMLQDLRIEHSSPDAVRAALSTLRADIGVRRSTQFRLMATIETDNGTVNLN